jgi:hypothetical protein
MTAESTVGAPIYLVTIHLGFLEIFGAPLTRNLIRIESDFLPAEAKRIGITLTHFCRNRPSTTDAASLLFREPFVPSL